MEGSLKVELLLLLVYPKCCLTLWAYWR